MKAGQGLEGVQPGIVEDSEVAVRQGPGGDPEKPDHRKAQPRRSAGIMGGRGHAALCSYGWPWGVTQVLGAWRDHFDSNLVNIDTHRGADLRAARLGEIPKSRPPG